MAKRGPRTQAGKRRSALNALAHGVLARTPVIPGMEDEAEWQRHAEGFRDSLAPATPFEAFLVERIAHTAWRLKRLELYEDEMLRLAQDAAEEQAAARILFPNGGAISLHGASAATLIQERIDHLRALADLLLALQSNPRSRARLTPDDTRLLYEGLNLALSPGANTVDTFQRQVLRELTAETPAEEARARDLAENVRALLIELDTMVDIGIDSAGAEPTRTGARRPIVDRYPIDLVLLRLWPELRRLEHELLDLDTTIARIRRQSLLLDTQELNRVTRYEAHLRRQFTQYLHELEAAQSQAAGHPTPLARLDVNHLTPGLES